MAILSTIKNTKNTADRRDLTGEEKIRLGLTAAAQQGASQGAALGTAAMPDYVAASKAKSAANQAIIGGATAGQSVQVQNAYQKALANAQPSVNVSVPVTERNTYSGAAVNPAVQAALGTPRPAGSQPAQMKDYLWYSWMGNNDMHTMNDDEKKKWSNAMAGYQQGDYRAFNQDFQTAGNWGSYVDENGNVSGMLRYAGDGIGGYLPVNNGKVMAGLNPDREYLFYGPGGEVYTADANGNLTRSGNWTADYDQTMRNGYYYDNPNRMFQGKDGQFYTYADVPDDKLAEWGYVRRNDGIFYEPQTIVTNKALESGQVTREQLAQAQAAQALRDGAAPANIPSSAGTNAPTQNAYQQYLEQITQNTQPAQNQPTQNAPVPTQRGSVDYSAGGRTPYQAVIDEWEYGPAPEWENSEYQRQRDEALRRAQNMRFSYDPESDPVWQAYQKQYRREGQRAMQDTMAEAAMRTGGLANSYAVSAAAQAGNYYAAELSDRLPQLYNDAYQRYLAEFQRQLGISDQYAGFDQTEYGRYADELGQWNKDRSFDYGLYRDRVGDARYADELAYDRAWNEENRDYSRAYQAQRDAILDNRADREWAQQLREYADAQNWKATEWQQYLREYGDQLSEQERQWAYQMARDAESDRRYNDETTYQRAMYADETAYDRGRDAVGDERYDTQWQQSLREYDDEQRQQEINNAWKRIQTTGYISEADAALLGIQPGAYSGSAASSGGRSSGGGYSGGSAESGNEGKRATAETHDNGLPKSTAYDQAWADVQSYARNPSYSKTMVLTYIKSLITRNIISDEEGNMMLLKLGYDKGSGGGGSYAPVSPNNVNMTK